MIGNKGNYKDGRSFHPFYDKWAQMLQRCTRPNNPDYKYYGGRGIKVCDKWFDPWIFFKWCEDNYEEGLELDRIDNDGDCTPENCEFTTHRENILNQRLIQSNNKSGFRGVSWHKRSQKWQVVIGVNRKLKHLGYFISKYHAALRYDQEAMKEGYIPNFLLEKAK